VIAAALIENLEDLRAVFRTWLAASGIVAAIAVLTVLLFAAGVEQPLGGYALHEFGTLPPGDYRRVESTFVMPAMLCNYLTVSLMILLLSWHLAWLRVTTCWVLLAMMLVTALFCLTPGLGGVFLAAGVWVWLLRRGKSTSGLALSIGAVAAVAFLLAAAVTPIIHPTAPFLIALPWTEQELAPAVRMMTWIDAAQQFARRPLLGGGIGADAVAVRYVSPSGINHFVTDAHNVFLNIAAQCGLVGLTAIIVLVAYVVRRTAPLRIDQHRLIQTGLGLAWLNAFVYQGLTGSYEDARHLWVLLGLLLAAGKVRAAPSIAAV
jgi:O-antigen ligase